MKRIMIVILCLVLAVAGGLFVKKFVSTLSAERLAREAELAALEKQYEGSLPVIKMKGKSSNKKTVAHYMVLVTDSADTIGREVAETCDLYDIAYTLDSSGFDSEKRLMNGMTVYGSYEENIKSNIISAILNGEDFYIGVGVKDKRDSYSVANIEAMCQFLSDYIADGSLKELVID